MLLRCGVIAGRILYVPFRIDARNKRDRLPACTKSPLQRDDHFVFGIVDRHP